MVPAPTARLVFRAWREDDLQLARELYGDRRVAELIGGPFDDAAIRARLAKEIASHAAHGTQYWPVFLASGAHVGCCGLRPRDPGQRVHELGFYLRAEHWGHGYASEAARSVIAHAFGPLGATALYAGHHPENHASRAVLTKLGFHYTHHELYPPTGLDEPCYELARDEWRAMQ